MSAQLPTRDKPALPRGDDRWLRSRELQRRLGVHKTTLWRWVLDERFPAPTKLGPNVTAWKLSDVEAWEERKCATPVQGARR